jgi:nitrogen regulatory protein PII-like uncharacterized protein
MKNTMNMIGFRPTPRNRELIRKALKYYEMSPSALLNMIISEYFTTSFKQMDGLHGKLGRLQRTTETLEETAVIQLELLTQFLAAYFAVEDERYKALLQSPDEYREKRAVRLENLIKTVKKNLEGESMAVSAFQVERIEKVESIKDFIREALENEFYDKDEIPKSEILRILDMI